MSSLQQQLNQFKQKQKADPKLPDNSSATFLFDFRTANKIDREMIFTIGYEGIKELARLDKKFIKYFEKLFNNTSKYFQRETKLKSELSEVDYFLLNLIVDLIDYFHLRAAHKVIEYLIKIFNINAYNPKLLALAFLPFHESKYYIKLMQNLNLELNQNFKFLNHFSKTGTVVLEELLFKEIFNNFDLIKEIFNFYEEKVIQNSETALEIKRNISQYTYQNSYNSVIESEKYFKFLIKLIKHFFTNLANNNRIDKTNFFITVLNFIRINIKHFSLVNEYANTKLANKNDFTFSSDFSADNKANNSNSNNKSSGAEINYIIKEICELIILINSKYKLTNEYANALLNDIVNNFLFFKNTRNLNLTNGEIVNSNSKKSAEFVLTSILLFVNEFELSGKNNESGSSFAALALEKDTLETLFENIHSFDFLTNAKAKNSKNKCLNNQKQSKTLFATILESLSNEFNFYPFLKLIINSVFAQIVLVFTEADKQQPNLNNAVAQFSNLIENCEVFNTLSNNIFQSLNFIKIQKSEVFSLCEYLLSLDDTSSNSSGSSSSLLLEFLQYKLSLSLLNSTAAPLRNKINLKEEISFAINKLIEKTFIHLENLYVDDFNYFLINFFEAAAKKKNSNNTDKSRLIKYLKRIENYKLLSSNEDEDNLFDLFVNLNTTNVNSVANSIEKIDQLISEDKGEIVKFTFNALIGKFANFEQEFLLKKILDMKNFPHILNQISATTNNNAQIEHYKTTFLEIFFKIYEEKIGLYSLEFLEKLNLFILHNFINISDPNEDIFNKFFIYFYTFDFKISEEKNLSKEIKSNKFLHNLIADNSSNEKNIEEFVKTLSCSNSIKSISHVLSLIKVLFAKKTVDKKTIGNFIRLVNKIHSNENSKFKSNCSTSAYMKLVAKIVEILNFLNLEIFNLSKNTNSNNSNKKSFSVLNSSSAAVCLLEELFYEISDNLISHILFHKDFLASISQIAFLILNSQAQKIRALFDKLINFVYEGEIFHFLTYLILADKSTLFETNADEDFDEAENLKQAANEMNQIFNTNIIDHIASKIIKVKFEHASASKNISNSSSSSLISFDFGFVLSLVYLLNESEDNSLRKKLVDIFETLNSQKDKIEISFLHYNSLFGLVAASASAASKNAHLKEINKCNSVITGLITLISNNKTEILINKHNLQKIFNNSNDVNFNLYLVAFDYFLAYSDEYTDFAIFNKTTSFIQRKLEHKISKAENKKDVKNNLNNNNSFNLEKNFNEPQIEFIFELIFAEALKNNPNSIKLQEEVLKSILNFFDTEVHCFEFVIAKLLQNSKLNHQAKYSQKLIRKIAQSNLLEEIDFTTKSLVLLQSQSIINTTTKNTTGINNNNSSSKKAKKESENNNSSNNDNNNAFHFIEFVDLIMEYDIASSEIANLTKINFCEILSGLLKNLKAELSIYNDENDKNHNAKYNNNNKAVNIRDTTCFIFEMVLKSENFSLAYSLKTLEFLEALASSMEIDSNFLVMCNNLFAFLTHTNKEYSASSHNDLEIKAICEKIEGVIITVCENLANKQKSVNEEFYIRNNNRTFSTQVYAEVEKMEEENKKMQAEQEVLLDEAEEDAAVAVVSNAMSYSYEYLNILNTLFISLNKAIILLSKKEFERDIVLRVINKAFEIFYANNHKIIAPSAENERYLKQQEEELEEEDFKMENEIGYKFKKDIFSVILKSIINFVTSLLSMRSSSGTTEKEDLDIFYEYIQTLVKLTIKNFNDDIYLDNILKNFLELIKPFDNRLVSCLFVTVYYYSIENNFERFIATKEINNNGSLTIIEQFSKFFEYEKEQNSYYNRIINSHFEDILELNYQKFDENSVAKVLLILEEILSSVSIAEKECDNNGSGSINNNFNVNNNVYFILSAEKNNDKNKNKNKICSFENIRNLLINLCIKILAQIKNLFYLNESQKLKENKDIYSIVLSINNKMLKSYKLSNQILNINKENKNKQNLKNYEVNELLLLTNVFNKNLKTFEDNFFEILIEANILHYLLVNIFDKVENEKEHILLRNFLLQKYLNLVKLDSESIHDEKSIVVSKNSAKAKKKAKNIEHFEAKFNDSLVVFKALLANFDKENLKNYENINLIFSVLTEIIIFTEKFVKLKTTRTSTIVSGKNTLDILTIIKESKRLDLIISTMAFENNANANNANNKSSNTNTNNASMPLSFYTSKFSIFNFVVKFFTVYELKFFGLFNKFIFSVQSYLEILYQKFFFNLNNNENKEILLSVLKSVYELVSARSEFMSPVIEPVILQISLLYEENFTAEIINKVYDTLAKKQLFDVSFKAIKFAFKNYDRLIYEKSKNVKDNIVVAAENKNEYNNSGITLLTYKKISSKINAVLGYFNTAIKHSDKLVITDMNLSIIKFIYKLLMNKNYNNNNIKRSSNKSIFTKKQQQVKEELINDNSTNNDNTQLAAAVEDKITNLSDRILECLKSLILKMNEKQFKVLFEEFLVVFFKEEIDFKNPDDLDTETIGNKYKLNNCVVTLQVFNEIFECLNSIFVSYFEKYKNVLIQIFNHINSVFCTANKSLKQKKKERSHFEETFDDETNKFSFLYLSNLAMRNVSLVFKYDKSVLMQETIQEIFEPISHQVIIN